MPIPPAPPPDDQELMDRRGRRRRGRARPHRGEVGSLRRSADDRLVAGVAGGVAARMGMDPTALRIGLVLLTVFGGIGAGAYLLAWLLVPGEGDQEPLGRRAVADLPGLGLAVAVFTVAAGLVLAAHAAGLGGAIGVLWPVGFTAAGAVLVWRNAVGPDREVLRRLAGHVGLVDEGNRRGRATVVRVVAGVGLVAAGIGGLFGVARRVPASPGLVAAALAVIAGFVIVFGPWWLRVGRDLAAERRERVRSEERADLAAHLHDSVLQTLALIQRSSANPREVTRLARAQERELRAWLFEGGPGRWRGQPGDRGEGKDPAVTVAGGIERIERDVELAYGVAVEAVVVGEADLDDDLRSLLGATREAVVNAAKWSGSDVVSLFAEIEAQRVSVFVRDRGVGFEMDAVAPDRRGIRESILGRVERRGGKAVVRATAGAGTEVELVMPRRPV